MTARRALWVGSGKPSEAQALLEDASRGEELLRIERLLTLAIGSRRDRRRWWVVLARAELRRMIGRGH